MRTNDGRLPLEIEDIDLLALDVSSYNIGVAFTYQSSALPGISTGVIRLSGSLQSRCADAYQDIWTLLIAGRPRRIRIEGPAGQHLQGVLPQARVQGGVYAALGRYGISDVAEYSPSKAKLALARSGKADKDLMLAEALLRLGRPEGTLNTDDYDYRIRFESAKRKVNAVPLRYNEERVAVAYYRSGTLSTVLTEHEADAIGGLLTEVPTLGLREPVLDTVVDS